jgi:Ni,Fe-hydrogenase I cytochrome b subunit
VHELLMIFYMVMPGLIGGMGVYTRGIDQDYIGYEILSFIQISLGNPMTNLHPLHPIP